MLIRKFMKDLPKPESAFNGGQIHYGLLFKSIFMMFLVVVVSISNFCYGCIKKQLAKRQPKKKA